MKLILKYKHLILGIVIGATLVYLLASLTTEKKLNNLQLSLDTALEKSLSDTENLASLLGQGIISKETEIIIADCKSEERASFEEKLNRLDAGLSRNDLQEIDLLFSRCAPVQPMRRSLMVMDLSTKIQNLEGLIVQRKQVSEFSKYDSDIANLKLLLLSEQKTTELSFALVYLQREIIDLLLFGKSASSSEAEALKVKGAKLRQEVAQISLESKSYREKLSNP